MLIDKDREPPRYQFTPPPDCDQGGKCEKMNFCWGAARIKANLDSDVSVCSHPQAEQAREEVEEFLGKDN